MPKTSSKARRSRNAAVSAKAIAAQVNNSAARLEAAASALDPRYALAMGRPLKKELAAAAKAKAVKEHQKGIYGPVMKNRPQRKEHVNPDFAKRLAKYKKEKAIGKKWGEASRRHQKGGVHGPGIPARELRERQMGGKGINPELAVRFAQFKKDKTDKALAEQAKRLDALRKSSKVYGPIADPEALHAAHQAEVYGPIIPAALLRTRHVRAAAAAKAAETRKKNRAEAVNKAKPSTGKKGKKPKAAKQTTKSGSTPVSARAVPSSAPASGKKPKGKKGSSASSKTSGKKGRKGGKKTSSTPVSARAVPSASKPASGKKPKGSKGSKGSKAASARRASKSASKQGKARRSGQLTATKLNLMDKYGVPPTLRVNQEQNFKLREAAGNAITVDTVLREARARKLKAWICIGKRRTGCGGGSRRLRGGHQIGVFATGHGR